MKILSMLLTYFLGRREETVLSASPANVHDNQVYAPKDIKRQRSCLTSDALLIEFLQLIN